jgi:hypothetical protein
MKPPKFKVGDKVALRKPTIYGEHEGVIVEIHQLYRPINPTTGKFFPGSLNVNIQSHHSVCISVIPSGKDRFELYWINTGRREIVAFYSHSYTVKTSKINAAYPERLLELKK